MVKAAEGSAAIAKIVQRAIHMVKHGWIQNAFAKNRLGKSVLPENENACYWCLAGAVTASVFKTFPTSELIRNTLATQTFREYVVFAIERLFKDRGIVIERFNDHRETTKDDVLLVLKLALKLAKEQAA